MKYSATDRALHSPPSSPTKDRQRWKSNSNHLPLTPDTTDIGSQKQMGVSPSGERLSGKKRPAPGSSDNSQDQPPTQKLRTHHHISLSPISKLDLEDGNKPVPVDEGPSSLPADILTFSMEHVLKMLRRVGTMNVDPLLACVMSAQTAMMACTADLMFRRAADEENKGHLTDLMKQLETNLKAEKKRNSELNSQISDLRKKLENRN